MAFNRIISVCLLLFFIGCGGRAVSPKAQAPANPPSVAIQKIEKLIEKALKLFPYSEAQGVDMNTLIKGFQDNASLILQEKYLQQADAFITELKADKASLENIIAVKNVFLDSALTQAAESTKTLAEQAQNLEALANNNRALELILKIRTNLYGPDGQLFKKLLLGAANDENKREAFFSGQLISECTKQHPKEEEEWYKARCALLEHPTHGLPLLFYSAMPTEYGAYVRLLLSFGDTDLRKNLDAFLETTREKGTLDKTELLWTAMKLLKISDYKSLDWLREYIRKLDEKTLKSWLEFFSKWLAAPKQSHMKKLISELEPELREVGIAIVESYVGKSLQELNSKDLEQFLEKLSALLKNEEFGPIWYIREYKKL